MNKNSLVVRVEQDQEQLELLKKVMEMPIVPFMSPEKFAELTGYPHGVVKGWINRGYISTFEKLGKHTPINMVELYYKASQNILI